MTVALILRVSGQLGAEMDAWLDEKFAEYDEARRAYLADRSDEGGAAIVTVRDEVNSMLRLKGYGA
jgi:recombinational DNA repair ATPase RecF